MKKFNVYYLTEGKWRPDEKNPMPWKSRKALAKVLREDVTKTQLWKIREA
jgi:hypothetical protein